MNGALQRKQCLVVRGRLVADLALSWQAREQYLRPALYVAKDPPHSMQDRVINAD